MVYSILKDREAWASLPPTTWHNFRRTILSYVITRSGLTTAQHLDGHSFTATTARYDSLWRENVREAINFQPDAIYRLV